ncbi:protein of unknown function [Flexibacter flexilis DSM 6793]|uniref:DUF4249 domain-containing protein n=2 Tax=Flexibacter flexilis TaxID=998 RepID=A0A1I1FNL2_9BACT|nr:protein of unknown function [Flexibacter flexilis DSM 6793]
MFMTILTRFFGFIAFVMLLGVAACSTDFDVNAPYTEKTVIYGLLDAADSVQTVRIMKTYLNNNGQNAYDVAKNPDSSLYADGVLRVDLYLVNPNSKQEIWKDSLHRVVLSEARENSGDFFTTPNVVYQTSKGFTLQTSYLNAPAIYKIKVTNKRTGHEATAQTEVLGDFSMDETISFSTERPAVYFTRVKPIYAYSVDIISDFIETTNGVEKPFSNIWGAKLYQQAKVAYNAQEGGRLSSGLDYLDFLLANIDRSGDQPTTKRNYVRVTYRVRVINQEFANYLSVSGNFFDLTQSQPTMTNVTGGLGIFSSRYTKIHTILPSKITISSLLRNPASQYNVLKIQ